jgi:hypothetical protein
MIIINVRAVLQNARKGALIAALENALKGVRETAVLIVKGAALQAVVLNVLLHVKKDAKVAAIILVEFSLHLKQR